MKGEENKKFKELCSRYKTMREFAIAIGEEISYLSRWKSGRLDIHPRAVISICRLHSDVLPHDLNPLFPKDLKFVFKGAK